MMIAVPTLVKMVAPARTVSIHILVRAPRDLVEPTVNTVSKISSIGVSSSFVQLWYSKILYKIYCNKRQWLKQWARGDFNNCAILLIGASSKLISTITVTEGP